MSVALTTYGTDRRLVLGAAEAIRAPIYLGDWQTIRIGLQCSFGGLATNISADSKLIIGVCSGSTNVMVSSSAGHVFGARLGVDQMTAESSGAHPTYSCGAHARSYKKVGTTETFGVQNSSYVTCFSNDTGYRSGIFVDIKKTATTSIKIGAPNTAAGASVDMTDALFATIMDQPDLNNISTIMGGGHSTWDTFWAGATCPTIDEATNGLLDHIFVYWSRSTHLFTFNIRHRKIN